MGYLPTPPAPVAIYQKTKNGKSKTNERTNAQAASELYEQRVQYVVTMPK